MALRVPANRKTAKEPHRVSFDSCLGKGTAGSNEKSCISSVTFRVSSRLRSCLINDVILISNALSSNSNAIEVSEVGHADKWWGW